MDSKIEIVEPNKARKKTKIKSQQKKAEKIKKLYSARGLPLAPRCGHNSNILKCILLTSNDMFHFHQKLYQSPSKVNQDNFILKHISVTKVKRLRPRKSIKKPRDFSIKFYIPDNRTKVLQQVCKNTFLRISRLKPGRIQGIAKRYFETGNVAKENRGGNRKKILYSSRQEAVEIFIKSLKPLEAHYSRNKIKIRKYLHPDLNIKKIFEMYDDQAQPGFSVKEGFFRHIFNTKFNIGFGSPRQDVCSTCLQLTERIKIENLEKQKKILENQLVIHKLRANCFYELLQEENQSTIILSFDCQKNLPLPKIPDQATYYSRQLYFYNLTFVIGSSHSILTPTNVHAYTWTEDQAAKGSNEICSALYHCLKNIIDLTNITKIRLVCDGCGGQNKNSIIIFTIMKWLTETRTPIKDIEIIFPVTGHSFLPSDRVFALNEKTIRKKENIITPAEYENIIKEHATAHKLATEVPIYDWKNQTKELLKGTSSWHFQLSKCKRIIFKKISKTNVTVRGEISYKNDLSMAKSLMKRGKKLTDSTLCVIPTGIPVKMQKLNDVTKLLTKHYGDNWCNIEELYYYKNILSGHDGNIVDDDAESEINVGDADIEEVLDFV